MNEAPNLIYVKQLADGDTAFETRLLGVLKKELPEEIKVYTKHYTQKNFLESANIVHKIKHKISILGLTQSHGLAEAYENELLEQNCAKHTDFLQILAVMIKFLNEH